MAGPLAFAGHTTNLQLGIATDKSAYVLREPIRFVGRISNPGPDTLRIVDVRYLTTDMKCVYLELETPDGISETRKFSYWLDFPLPNPHYVGEPLLPGDTVEFVIYPNVSEPIPWSVEADERNVAQGGITFAKAGEYKVRLVYEVFRGCKDLHEATGRVISEELRLRFRQPTNVEKEILDACWASGGFWISMGEGQPIGRTEEGELWKVIERFPEAQMTDYARLLLAKSLTAGKGEELLEAEIILREIRKRRPEFRPEETLQLLAFCLRHQHRYDDAMLVINEALEVNPLLSTRYGFVWNALVTWMPGPHDATRSPFRLWDDVRKRGDRSAFWRER